MIHLIDPLSFFIGASTGVFVWFLYTVYKPCFAKPPGHVKTPTKRIRGSRKEDVGIYVDKRAERRVYFDGKFRYRRGDIKGED